MDANLICRIAVNVLDDKKAQNIKVLKIDELTSFGEYFVIATATSSTHVHSLSDEVQEKLENSGVNPHHIEGRSTGWIVLDYVSVIVHIFTPDQREFYGLDDMWKDSTEIDVNSFLDESKGK